jgi:CBS domain-containing protein
VAGEVVLMLSEQVRHVMEKDVLVASPDTSVSAAAKLMVERKSSAILVLDGGRLAGIFTEQDAVYRVIAEGRDARLTRLDEVMTAAPRTVTPDRSFGYALLMMHENGFRHVPVLEDGVPVGMVSARDALDPELEEFEFE